MEAAQARHRQHLLLVPLLGRDPLWGPPPSPLRFSWSGHKARYQSALGPGASAALKGHGGESCYITKFGSGQLSGSWKDTVSNLVFAQQGFPGDLRCCPRHARLS